MSDKYEVYKCEKCGAMVTVLKGGAGTLVCCDQPMNVLKENKTEAATEKHIPVVEKINGGYRVSVGSVIHPMSNEHLIEWVELLADGRSYFKHFGPDEKPVAEFLIDAKDVKARAFCNLHGLWSDK